MIFQNRAFLDLGQGLHEVIDFGRAVRTEFHDQKSPGLEPSSGVAKNGLDEFKTICAAMKRCSRLVVLHITIKSGVLGFRDVWRVRADDVEDTQVRVRQCFEQGTQTKFELLIKAVTAGIPTGQLEGLPDDIGRGHEEWPHGARIQVLDRGRHFHCRRGRHRLRNDRLTFEIEDHLIGGILGRCGLFIETGPLRGSLRDWTSAQRQDRGRQTDRDTSTSGAQIENPPLTRETAGLDLVKGEFNQPLGAGTRDERAGRNLELSTVKRPGTHQILDGLMLRRPLDQCSQGAKIVSGKNSIRFHVETQAFAAQNMPEQKLGTDSGRVDVVGLQETSDPVQQLASRPIGLP